MTPNIVHNPNIVIPSVIRSPSAPVDEEELPLGIQLTGGKKLREEGLTGKGVKVAVIDSGVDEKHPGFHGQVKYQIWFRWGTPLEVDDHGTHVAGTIHMMAPDAEIYDYRVFGEEAGFPVDQAIAVSIYEACFDGCHVINLSLGGRWPSTDIRTAVQYAASKGVVVVCAAGNEGDADPLTNERSYPALWDEAVSIAAVGKSDDLPVAYFSNSNPQVDFAGIGVDVNSFKPGGEYQKMSGTSMACPHVAGLIAALMSDDKNKEHKHHDHHHHHKKSDHIVNQYLKDCNIIDIEVKGPDNATGVGFVTYLTEKEFELLREV